MRPPWAPAGSLKGLTPYQCPAAAAAFELFRPRYFRGGAIGFMAITAMADQEYAHDFLTLSRKVSIKPVGQQD
jgi:hypothetical protein